MSWGRQLADNLRDIVHAMPKIELHRHLEGSLRLTSLVEIAETHGIMMPEYEIETIRTFVQVMPDQPRTSANFIGKFSTLRQFYLSPEVIQRLTREVVIDAAEDNVKYMELRFTPNTLCKIIKCNPADAIQWVCETALQTAEEYDIQIGLIVSMNRHEGVDIAEQAADAAIKHYHMGIIALDLAGVEEGHSASKFKHIFQKGRDAGLNITLHAGEWEGAQSVWDAVGNVGAERIGHGIRAIEDPGVLSILKERGTVLEVCPTSNVDSGAVPSFAAHPLRELIDEGINVTINTDDPLVSNITLSDELYRTITHFDLTIDDIKKLTLLAAKSAFLSDDKKQDLILRFQNWLYT